MRFLSRFVRPAKPPAFPIAFEAVVVQARRPEFFTAGQVPDTTEGRFELLLLHLFILLHAVRDLPGTESFRQGVFDTAFGYLDWNLREIGVGDMTVGKKIRRMAEIFYGRIRQYHDALEAGEDALAEAIGSRLYPVAARPDAGVTRALAAYAANAVSVLRRAAATIVSSGEVNFPAPVLDGKTG